MRWGRSVSRTRRPPAISAAALTRAPSRHCRPRSTRRGCGSGARSPPRFSRTPSSTRTGRWPRPPGSAKRGWTSPIPACGATTRWWCHCEHAGAAVPGQPPRQPPIGGRRGGAVRSGARAVSRGGLSAHHVPRRHRFLPDAPLGSVGPRRGAIRVWLRCPRQCHPRGRRPASARLGAAGAAPAVRSPDRAAPAAREREREACPPRIWNQIFSAMRIAPEPRVATPGGCIRRITVRYSWWMLARSDGRCRKACCGFW